MVTHWVLVADAAHAQVYESGLMFETMAPVESWIHPASRAKASELVAGDRGSTRGFTEGMKSSFERHTDPHRATVEAFARELAEALRVARVERRYERLVIAAPPSFLGMLRQQLDEETGRTLVREIPHDWVALEPGELATRVRKEVAA